MNGLTNRQCLQRLSDEELAKFFCHLAQSGKLTMDDISVVLEKYRDAQPSNFECMLTWLRSPAE